MQRGILFLNRGLAAVLGFYFFAEVELIEKGFTGLRLLLKVNCFAILLKVLGFWRRHALFKLTEFLLEIMFGVRSF